MKSLLGVYNPPNPHWVGDGFPVRSMFSYHHFGFELSPFLLLDFAGPAQFPPAAEPRGVGPHPHRGFETVTIVYHGEVAHRDSTGQGGVIGPGDVQWMTAGAGILHEEFHSEAFTRHGGQLEMMQLWVNLPARDKMTPPAYQAIVAADIPNVELPAGAGTIRVIAGEYAGQRGPATTFSPMQVWDVRLAQGANIELPLAEGWGAGLVVMHGSVQINQQANVNAAQLVVLDRAGQNLQITAGSDATILLLSGQPLDEPIVGHGPFVMNTQAEINQAINDYNAGKFGTM